MPQQLRGEGVQNRFGETAAVGSRLPKKKNYALLISSKILSEEKTTVSPFPSLAG